MFRLPGLSEQRVFLISNDQILSAPLIARERNYEMLGLLAELFRFDPLRSVPISQFFRCCENNNILSSVKGDCKPLLHYKLP